jgi:hypothetical protein
VAFLLFTLAYVFSMDAEHFSLIVLDQDKTPLSRQYVADLTSDGTFQVMAYVGSYAEIDAWLQAGRANAAFVIPPGTPQEIKSRVPGQLIELRPEPLEQARAALAGRPEVIEVHVYGDLLHMFVDDASRRIPQVQTILQEAGIQVRGVRVVQPRMEEAFVSLIRLRLE